MLLRPAQRPYSRTVQESGASSLSGYVEVAAARCQNVPVWTWTYAVLLVIYNPVLLVHLGSRGMQVIPILNTLIVLWMGPLLF